ncbi:MAG: PfkB family carbohydrate kinase [Candidatus Sericytochromatia bacterium]|nr:PfkB family carbohydrate kinase [Candidatus Sericytochromatia bacterium]
MLFDLSPARFDALTTAFPSARVLVVGDLFADEYVRGEVTRISREAPVLILAHRESRVFPGGAANAAANIASLGGRVEMAGVVGADTMAPQLRDELEQRGVGTALTLADASRPTTTKSRISASSLQSVTQQIVRVDREDRGPIAPALEDALLAAIEARIRDFDAVLLSDYGNGVLTPRVIAGVLALAEAAGTIVTVDSQGDLRRFPGAWVLTPNQPEAEAVVGFPITDAESLHRAGRQLLADARSRSMLITRGGHGMALFEASGETTEIPAFNRSEVFDVTGAGDTVVGTLTLALAAGASLKEAIVLANVAASIVVRRFGTSVTTREEVTEAFQALAAQPTPEARTR